MMKEIITQIIRNILYDFFMETLYLNLSVFSSIGSVKKFVSLVKNGSFLVRIKI